MGKLKLAVLGKTRYAGRLANYIQKNGPEYLEVASYLEAGKLAEILSNSQPDILLYEQDLLCEQEAAVLEQRGRQAVKILLTDTKSPGMDGCPVIFRYQQGGQILRQIFQIYEEVSGKNLVYWYKTKDLEMAAVYAPGGHELHLPFSIAYASLCGKSRKVLFLNLSEFSGMNQLFGDEEGENFSDLIYGIRQKKEKFQLFLQRVLHHAQGFDYVQPPENPEDLYELQEEDLEILLSLLREQSEYQFIVFHCGMMNQWSGHVMGQCGKVFCVVKENLFGKFRKAEFERLLEKEGMGKLRCNVKYVSPQSGNVGFVQGVNLLSQLQSGEFAAQVRELVQDE